MKWDEIENEVCSVSRTLAVVGDRWTMLIIRDAFLRVRRFDDFQKNLGMSRHRLSERLKKLVEYGVLKKEAYQTNRYEYRLTEKGLELYPILISMAKWGDKWMDDGKGVPMLYKHNTCGHHYKPVVVCSECGEPIDPHDVTPEIGPGKFASSRAHTALASSLKTAK